MPTVRHRAVPGVSLRDHLASKGTVISAPEKFTTKMHHACQQTLSFTDKGSYHFPWCPHCSCHVDRDLNAALNIRAVVEAYFRGEPRPSYLDGK